MSDLTGKTVGNYRIVERIGRGGMATVYKAYQPSLERYVAVKVIHEMLVAEDEQFLKRFHREAKSVAALRHPNIVQVFDFGVQDDIPYMVMEYLEGVTLKAELNSLAERGETMAWTEVDRIFKQVAGAVDYAHTQGMVHRDLKPANIMLTAKGDVVLTDFGVARIIGGTQYTITGVIAGTPAYLSPEQGKGERGDARSDIYALGIILYEMLTGQVPFDADTPWAIIVKHISDPLPLPRQLNPEIPEKAERVILKALSKSPGDRYQSAADMVKALNHTMVGRTRAIATPSDSGQRLRERPTEVLPPPQAPLSRAIPPWLWAAGGLILGIALFGIAYLLFAPDGPEPTATATVALVVQEPTDDEADTPTPADTGVATSTSAPIAAVATDTREASPTSEPSATRVPTHTPVPTPTQPAPPRAGQHFLICEDPSSPQLCLSNSAGELTPIGSRLDFEQVWSPGWAPDGRRLLFVARSGQANPNIYVTNFDGGELEQLTGDDTFDQGAQWSPDGLWIAFVRDCSLWLMRPDGSNAHVLIDAGDFFCAEAISWSPSSVQIAVINFSLTDPSRHGIWVVDRDGSPPRLAHAFERTVEGGATAWSPDGSQIFCWCSEGEGSWFQIINADGSGDAEIVGWDPYWWSATFWPRWGSIDYSHARVVSIDLGRRNESLGLVHLSEGGDGLTRGTTVGDLDARGTVFNGSGGRYIYFDVDSQFISAEKTRVLVVVEYYDQGDFSFGINYDSTDSALAFEGAFKEGDPSFISLRNSGEWKTAIFDLPDAYFGNRQQGNADFRIGTDDNDLYINRVTVIKP